MPYICDTPINDQQAIPVDVHFHSKGISIIGDWYYMPAPVSNSGQKLTLRETFDRLPIAIQQTCGRVVFPPNNGTTLLNDIATTSGTLFGASDASLKNHRSSHAWIISSGSTQDIEEPL